jgi:hypothetical protein
VSKAVATGEVAQDDRPSRPSGFPRSRWENNVAWRDRVLMAIARSWRERPVRPGPPDASFRSKR